MPQDTRFKVAFVRCLNLNPLFWRDYSMVFRDSLRTHAHTYINTTVEVNIKLGMNVERPRWLIRFARSDLGFRVKRSEILK